MVDGVELVATPEVLAQAGKLNPAVTAVMVGSNLNEGRFLMPLVMPVRKYLCLSIFRINSPLSYFCIYF